MVKRQKRYIHLIQNMIMNLLSKEIMVQIEEHLFIHGLDILSLNNAFFLICIFFRGEIQSCHLGCAIKCWDADLNSAVPVDEPGELVCTKPFPSMPVRFWNDPEFQLYRAAYFDKIPGKFCIAIIIRSSNHKSNQKRIFTFDK